MNIEKLRGPHWNSNSIFWSYALIHYCSGLFLQSFGYFWESTFNATPLKISRNTRWILVCHSFCKIYQLFVKWNSFLTLMHFFASHLILRHYVTNVSFRGILVIDTRGHVRSPACDYWLWIFIWRFVLLVYQVGI